MNYDLRIVIAIGDISMDEITELQEAIDELIERYELKDKNLQIGDAGNYIRQPFVR